MMKIDSNRTQVRSLLLRSTAIALLAPNRPEQPFFDKTWIPGDAEKLE